MEEEYSEADAAAIYRLENAAPYSEYDPEAYDEMMREDWGL